LIRILTKLMLPITIIIQISLFFVIHKARFTNSCIMSTVLSIKNTNLKIQKVKYFKTSWSKLGIIQMFLISVKILTLHWSKRLRLRKIFSLSQMMPYFKCSNSFLTQKILCFMITSLILWAVKTFTLHSIERT
jgi:hypothetical protein